MIEERGTVIASDGDVAWVETFRRNACDGCKMNKGCGTATLSRVVGTKRSRVRVINRIRAKVGDVVCLGLGESALVKGAFTLYAVPLLALLSFSLLGAWIGVLIGSSASEPFAILFGVSGLGLSMVWLRQYAKRIRHDEAYQPVILRVER